MFTLFFFYFNCTCVPESNILKTENSIIYQVKYKSNLNELDTFWVSENDTNVFKKEEMYITRPCSNPEFTIRYNMIAPINNAYYYIYNEKQQLSTEGVSTYGYLYEGVLEKFLEFHNQKYYYYGRCGCVNTIHYMLDGRNHKTESFDKKNRLSQIRYLDKKSGDVDRIEIYKKGELKETHVYTSFKNYDVIKNK